ncbi:MAG: acetate--CoA ligase [Gemmatimonadota bacterium]|nr:acetate--CoA ligase [Gemmatimonadota bacterium]
MADRTGATIEARLGEQPTFPPPESFVVQANMADPAIYDRFDAEYPHAFEKYADLLEWDERWSEVLDVTKPPFYRWFVGGKLNASVSCVDRHLQTRGDELALLWVGEPGDERYLSYRDLHAAVNAWASMLRSVGVGEDDVVTLHMPMVPELPIAMLACARIGAPHSVVFGGFSARSLATRIDDAKSRFLVTIDGYYRRGDLLDHKRKADEALERAETEVEAVLVCTRHDEPAEGLELVEGRDRLVPELLAGHEGSRVVPVSRDADDILFLMYTSGTTGRPKGVQHSTGGYLAYATATSKYVLDIEPEDVYWCAADIGWITGHSYIVYGPLALGTTSVMYEGAPDTPTKDRIWRIAEEHEVDIFHTSPTAIRMFMKWGPEHVEAHDLDFRLMVTVGEPIQPKAWLWYHEHVGGGEAVIVDTWWQTETGGHVIASLPALEAMRPGHAGRPLPGIDARIVDDEGEEIPAGSEKAGNLVLCRPWPGMLQTLYGNDERYVEEYWAAFSDVDSGDWRDWRYRTGDGAYVTEGDFRILGRLDDVINVAGHRLGTMELESAVQQVDEVAEAAVATRRDPQKGQVPEVYAILKEGAEREGVEERIVAAIEEEIGKFARPRRVHVVDDLPKTRSGKIMRRLLQDISNDEELGDTTTLRDPSVPERIREQVRREE